MWQAESESESDASATWQSIPRRELASTTTRQQIQITFHVGTTYHAEIGALLDVMLEPHHCHPGNRPCAFSIFALTLYIYQQSAQEISIRLLPKDCSLT